MVRHLCIVDDKGGKDDPYAYCGTLDEKDVGMVLPLF